METRVIELVKGQKLITLSTNDTVSDALDKLAQNNITSAPVFDFDKARALGFLDVLDLLAFLINTVTKPLTTRETAESRYLNTDDERILKKRAKDFQLAHVYDVIDQVSRPPIVRIRETDSLQDALDSFAKNKIHRMVVQDNEDHFVGILTQSMLVRHLENYISKHEVFSKIRAADIKMTPVDEMVLVGPKCPAVDALMTMHNNKVSAVAILEGRQLEGNLSASDLKSPLIRDFKGLLEPVHQWLKETHKAMNKSPTYLVTCTQDTLLPDMIHRLNTERVHRIFVVDHATAEQGRVLGVISLTDILQSMSSGVQAFQRVVS